MTSAARRGLALAALHVALVGSLGVKLAIDRATLPRVWVRTAPVDPDLPIRGRYIRLRIEVTPGRALFLAEPPAPVVTPDGRTWTPTAAPTVVTLGVEGSDLVATRSARPTGIWAQSFDRGGRRTAVITQPLAYFIAEAADDPSVRPPGEELWVEVSVPHRGLPRPIRLGVRKDDAVTPLEQP